MSFAAHGYGTTRGRNKTTKEAFVKAKLRLLLLPLALGVAAIAAVASSSGASADTPCPKSPCTSAVAPVVKTMPATSITTNGATLSGTVDPGASPATCYFNYGESTTYDMRTPDQTVTPKTGTATTQTIGAKLVGLQSKQPFHYQLVCTNAVGPTKGSDVTFTTADHGPSKIKLSGHTGFVSSTGTAGVFIGCYGDRNCTGSLTLTRNGAVIGHRSYYFIFAGDGGIVHVPLASSAMHALKQQGRITVTVASKTTQGQELIGGDAGLTLKFHIYR